VIAFLIVAGLLVAGALLLVLPPLLGYGRGARLTPAAADAAQAATALAVLREQLAELEAERQAGGIDDAEYARSREELERRALDEGKVVDAGGRGGPARGWAVSVAVAVPALAVAVYLMVGTPAALDPKNIEGQAGFTAEQVQDMVGTLVARLEKEPDNIEGWVMLARSWMVLENYAEASKAFARLAELIPNNADVIADWADVVAAQHGSVVGEAEALIQRALEIDPDHVKALALAGTAAYQKGDFAAAATHWERILARVPPGEAIREALRSSVDDARAKAGLPPLAAESAAAVAPAVAAPSAPAGVDATALTISGRLELDAALQDRVMAEDTVFVFVRGGEAGPPIAAQRFKAAELPLDFSFAGVPPMMADAPLPPTVSVMVRISRSGDVAARPGDIEGRVTGLAPDASGVVLRASQVRE